MCVMIGTIIEVKTEMRKDNVRCMPAGYRGNDALPRRKLTSLMTRYNGSNLMIDCGEGTQVAVKEKDGVLNLFDVICLTHYHADDISGLSGLLPSHRK